jgi:hypothetical protein
VTARRGLVPGITVAVIALVGLLIAGSEHLAVRTAAVDAPNQFTIAVLHPAKTVCEGPITAHGPTRSVGIWGGSTSGTARLTVDVQDASTHTVLASGALVAVPVETEWTARLTRNVPGGRPLRICLTGHVSGFSLAGSAASSPTVAVTGVPTGERFSLVLLSDSNRSLLGSLSTAFSRASLWRPGWVENWTFWVLAFALLAAFGLGVAAVTSAASADDEEDGLGDDPDRNDVPPPPPDPRSEAGQDRPQTVL